MSANNVLRLYSGSDCHLCEQAQALLYPLIDEQSWRLQIIVIDGDDALVQRYGTRIPVVVTPDGREKGWPFSVGQVRRLMLENPDTL